MAAAAAAEPPKREVIRFYSPREKPYGLLSNYALSPIVVDGKRYRSVEHYYQSAKYHGVHNAFAEAVRVAQTPNEAKKLAYLPKAAVTYDLQPGSLRGLIDQHGARDVKLRPDWDAVRLDVMRKAHRAKFTQLDHCRVLLLGTGRARLEEQAPLDAFWGTGPDGTGANWQGELLMELRDELLSHASIALGVRSGSPSTAATAAADPPKRVVIRFGKPEEQPYGVFCPDALLPVTVDGKTYPSVKHYYYCARFLGAHDDYAENIRAEATVKGAKLLAWLPSCAPTYDEQPPPVQRLIDRYGARGVQLRPDWEKTHRYLMGNATACKLRQHKAVGDLLMSTGDAELVADLPEDAFWGAGPDGQGQNQLGQLLMDFRRRQQLHLKRKAQDAATVAAAAAPPESKRPRTQYKHPSDVPSPKRKPQRERAEEGKDPPPGRPARGLTQEEYDGLSREQKAVLLAILQGKNVFFSGSAGTGKSHLLKLLPRLLPADGTFYTASTGLAAVNISGTTLNSFAGVGKNEQKPSVVAARIRNAKQGYSLQLKERWQDAQVLVIDEISMVDAPLFAAAEYIARKVRSDPRPFGGIQLVLSGDFLQLPPVKATEPLFRSTAWLDCVDVSVVLSVIFRQSDAAFAALLDRMRVAQLALKDIALLKKAHYTQLPVEHGVEHVRLYAHKASAQNENDQRLARITGVPTVTFLMERAITDSKYEVDLEMLVKDCPAPQVLQLKVGAQVILLQNLDTARGLCNGSCAVVVDFREVSTTKFGGRAPDTPAGVHLRPVLQFDNGVVLCLEPNLYERKIGYKTVAQARQLPLALAWALTIHKAQGATLERAEIDAARCFEAGQVYVAVSRVKSLQGLRLHGFDPAKVRADPATVKWYEELKEATPDCVAQLLTDEARLLPRIVANATPRRAASSASAAAACH